VDDLWATKSEDVGLIVHAISLQDFQPTAVCGHDPTMSPTDGQTDDMRSQDQALHYTASRGKKQLTCIVWTAVKLDKNKQSNRPAHTR